MKLPNGEIVISDMNPSDLRHSHSNRRRYTLRVLKKLLRKPSKIAREIAASANTSGGTILIGVHAIHKQIAGIRAYFEEESGLQEAAQEIYVFRPVQIYIELVHLPDAERDGCAGCPNERQNRVYLKGKKRTEQVFVRFQDESVLASDEQNRNSKTTVFKHGRNV
ncbi:helix-turn-helix domain-containing protein [Rhodohalobacter sp.]|uniref:AlbA family DNA-binding domain-containing protein n=1 Tax=Rhodohalobacter sp. TaxID=1974210 RepID=UPI002ACDE3EF|nr:RNA-binding domain-containing protein [Rhodohalobacter sp.]MDZ7758287.1 putative DNA binding domain-containing protein [Rhodohalobacter sp.]